MFSGLVTATSPVLEVKEQSSLLNLVLKRPPSFLKLQEGESIAVDGVCLSLKDFDERRMSFDLGPETLRLTGWTVKKIKNKIFNLEQSLSLQSAVGGQILTGHVDALAKVLSVKKEGESMLLTVQIPKKFTAFIWEKGYLALNGVSLTVNTVRRAKAGFCIIPETLKRSNLSLIKEGDLLNFEVDYMSRPFVNIFEKGYKKMIMFFIVFAGLLAVLLFIKI